MIQELLRKYGFSPDEGHDQHFIDSRYLLSREIDEAEVSDQDAVLEIGGGMGTLTTMLADRAGSVHVIENDPKLVKIIRNEAEEKDNVEVVQGDALAVEWPVVDKCVSNPPYHISAELIERLGERQIFSVLSLQKEFVDKLVAAPGSSSYCWTTVLCNYYFVPVFVQDIPSDAFYPEPRVASAIVKLFPNEGRFDIEDGELFLQVTKALFNHDRQKLRNAFTHSRNLLGISKEEAKAVRDDMPHADERVINLDMKQLAEVVAWWRRNNDEL